MEHIGRYVKQINTLMERNFNNALSRFDLTTAQLDVLILLFKNQGEPMCQKQIEEKLMLKNPTVTGILKRLEAKGFIERKPYEHDRRFNQIVATERAYEIDAMLLGSVTASEAKLTSGFTDEEREQLISFLKRLISNIPEIK